MAHQGLICLGLDHSVPWRDHASSVSSILVLVFMQYITFTKTAKHLLFIYLFIFISVLCKTTGGSYLFFIKKKILKRKKKASQAENGEEGNQGMNSPLATNTLFVFLKLLRKTCIWFDF